MMFVLALISNFRIRFKRFLFFFPTLSVLFLSVSAQATIPDIHIKDIDELFSPGFKKFSPLTGLIYHREFIPNFFHYGSELSPELSELLHAFFTEVPGGEVVTTHQGKNPAAHLSASAVAGILIELDKFRNLKNSSSESLKNTQIAIIKIISDDPWYLSSTLQSKKNIERAELEYNALEKLFETQKTKAAEIERFKKENITPLDRKITKLKTESKKLGKPIEEITTLEAQRSELESQYRQMRQDLITSDQMKQARRKLAYDQMTNDVTSGTYQKDLANFVENIVKTFIKFDLGTHKEPYYQNATTILLTSFVWMKYFNKKDLKPYLEAFNQYGALGSVQWASVNDGFYEDYYTSEHLDKLKKEFQGSWFKGRWMKNNFVASILLGLETSPNIPEVVSFGYLKWINYSSYPDCVENAAHNIFDLIAFNPKNRSYDVTILERLRDSFYPHLSEKVIQYYHRYHLFAHHDSPQAAAEWIDVVSGLNDGLDNPTESDLIKYRRERSHLASPYSNLVKAINRMFGYDNIAADRMTEIFDRVKQVSEFEIVYSNKGIDKEGYGIATFSAGKDIFSLSASRPVHIQFSVAKNKSNEIVGTMGVYYHEKTKEMSKNPEQAFRDYSGLVHYLAQGVLQGSMGDLEIRRHAHALLLFSHYQSTAEKLGLNRTLQGTGLEKESFLMNIMKSVDPKELNPSVDEEITAEGEPKNEPVISQAPTQAPEE